MSTMIVAPLEPDRLRSGEAAETSAGGTARRDARAAVGPTPRTTSGKPDAASPPRVRMLVTLFLIAGVVLVAWRYSLTPAVGPAMLTLSGNVDVRQVNLSFKVGGRIEELRVDEGDAVKAGQVLSALDRRYFEDEVRLAKAKRDQAAAEMERLENGSRPEEVEQARAREAEQEAAFRRADEDLRRAETLAGRGAATRQLYDQAAAARREAEARLRSASAARELAEIGPRAEDVAAGRARLEAAEAELVAAERRLADSRFTAPHDGVILTRAREAGAIVNPGETVFTLTLSSPVWVRTYVDEPDLGAVRPGAAVTVATDGGRTYAGRVGFVSPTAEFTPKTVESRELRTDLVYRVRVVVDDPDGGLRQGMPVTASVESPAPRPRTFRERLAEAVGFGTSGRGKE